MNRRATRRLAALFAAFAFLALPVFGWAFEADLQVYPVREVAPGLIGTGYTVVQGSEIEPFHVEILGVLEHAGPAGSLVLVRVSGQAIDRTGGIAAGMSGSPVYVDGRLLGAIGYGFEMADHRVGLVTPAEDMFDVLDMVLSRSEENDGDQDGSGLDRPQDAGDPEAPSGVVLAPSLSDRERVQRLGGEGVWAASPVATPLVVSGLGQRTMGRFRSLVASQHVLPLVGGASADTGSEVPPGDPVFRPGSAIGVQLMRGDVEITAIGTVTHVEDKGFVAFGHPFFNRGDAGYMATQAEIVATISSLSAPFKLGSAGAAAGAVTQDRGAAIGGRIGEAAATVRLSVNVTDADRRKESTLSASAVRDEGLTVPLLVIGALEALDRGIDRIGAGTGWVELKISGDGLSRPLSRSNMVHSEGDIAAQALVEAYEALQLLEENEFKDPELRSVDIDVRVQRGRKTVTVVKATPHSSSARPGDQVLVDVTLRPYRENAFTLTVPLEIPKRVAPGDVTVTVQGGGNGAIGFLPDDFGQGFLTHAPGNEQDMDAVDRTRAQSLDKIVEDFESRPKNNELVLEFYPPYGSVDSPEPGAADRDEADGGGASQPADDSVAEPSAEAFYTGDYYDPPDSVRATHATEYVVEGDAYFTLSILDPVASEAFTAHEPPSHLLFQQPPGVTAVTP